MSAIVSCRGTSKNPYHFSLDGGEDLDSYKSMYEKIKQLHSEKARDIRAIVSQYFKLHFRERTPQPGASQSQSQSQTPSSQPRSSQKRARAETATDRQNRAREAVRDVDRLTGNHTTAIWEEWLCRNKNCKGYGKPCFILQGGAHVGLNRDDLLRWSEQIHSGNASLEVCPESLSTSLLMRHWNETSGKTGKKKKQEDDSQRLPMNIHIHTASGGSTAVPVVTEPRSSPPAIPGHDFDNLARYLHWLVDQGKLKPAAKDLAATGLEDLGYGYSALGEVLDTE